MNFLATQLAGKMVDKIIEKQGQKRGRKIRAESLDENYIGYYAFGMEIYGLSKVMIWFCTFLMVLFMIFALSAGGGDGIIVAIAGVFLEISAIFMLVYAKKNSGIIMYSNDGITICKGNGEMVDFSISGLKSITVQGRYMVYEGYGEMVRVLCMGDGVVAYFNHMNARRPDLMQPLLAYRNVVYMLNQDVEKHSRMRHQ